MLVLPLCIHHPVLPQKAICIKITKKKSQEEETRYDMSDGKAYTKQQFIDFYGGTEEWDLSVSYG